MMDVSLRRPCNLKTTHQGVATPQSGTSVPNKPIEIVTKVDFNLVGVGDNNLDLGCRNADSKNSA